jgi:hypothetical protein
MSDKAEKTLDCLERQANKQTAATAVVGRDNRDVNFAVRKIECVIEQFSPDGVRFSSLHKALRKPLYREHQPYY